MVGKIRSLGLQQSSLAPLAHTSGAGQAGMVDRWCSNAICGERERPTPAMLRYRLWENLRRMNIHHFCTSPGDETGNSDPMAVRIGQQVCRGTNRTPLRRTILAALIVVQTVLLILVYVSFMHGPLHLSGDARLLSQNTGIDLKRVYYCSHITGGYHLTYTGPAANAPASPPDGIYSMLGTGAGQFSLTTIRLTTRLLWPQGREGPLYLERSHTIVRRLALPLVGPAVGCAWAIAAIWGVEFLKARFERKPGTCRKCGYDLTGLPFPRCPECGTSLDSQVIKR